MELRRHWTWDVEDEEEDICFAIAYSFVLLTVFEFSFVPLHSLYPFEKSCAKGGVLAEGFSPRAIETKACTRVSGVGTDIISPPTTYLVR